MITFVDITLFENLGCKKALADKRRVAEKTRPIIFNRIVALDDWI